MKIDEPFRPEINSEAPPSGLDFRLAKISDCESIFALMSIRNPSADKQELLNKTKKELEIWNDGRRYGLFVCCLNTELLGFCRFYHSDDLPAEKRRYPAPSGYYAMGMMVAPKWRRNGIARFLFEQRNNWLKKLEVKSLYSIVAVDNLTSYRMHLNFGYEELGRAKGFLNLSFRSSEGVLFKLILSVQE